MHHGKLTTNTAAGLKELQKRIRAAKIPSSKLDETLNVATWNIREFGRRKRKTASLHYIAEIIGQFDLVVLVELRDDVTQLARVSQRCALDHASVTTVIVPNAPTLGGYVAISSSVDAAIPVNLAPRTFDDSWIHW